MLLIVRLKIEKPC